MSRRMILALSNISPTFDVELTYTIPDSGVLRNLILISSTGLNIVKVDWGDGVVEDRQVGSTQLNHAYSSGVYTAKFTSTSENLRSFSIPSDGREVLTRVEHVKGSTIIGIASAFINAGSIVYVGEFDIPRCQNFNTAFQNCSAIISNVPNFWETNAGVVTSHNNTFTGCANAANYSGIPNDWKGL